MPKERKVDVDCWVGINRLNGEYWFRVDRLSDAPVDGLYVPDGVFEIGSVVCNGREAINEFFRQRAENEVRQSRLTRHYASALVITPIGDDAYSVFSTVHVAAGKGALPLQATPPATIADFQDIVVRENGEWLYKRRSATVLFLGGGAAAFAR